MDLFMSFSEMEFFCLWGLAASIIVVIPNFFFAKSAKDTRVDDMDTAPKWICRFEVISRWLLPIVLTAMKFPVTYDLFGIAAGVVLAVYFMVWIRFFREGSYYPDIYMKNFLGMPLPFDVLNIAYFILVSLWLCNSVALVLSLVYGVCRMSNAVIARKDLYSRD